MHVVATEIECPGDFVEGGEDDGRGSVLGDGFPNAIELFGARGSGAFFTEDEDGCLRQGGAAFPKGVEDIFGHGFECQASCFQVFLQSRCFLVGVYPSVDAYLVSFVQAAAQPFGDGGCFGEAILEESDAGAFQLFFGLDEVTGVCPKSGVI